MLRGTEVATNRKGHRGQLGYCEMVKGELTWSQTINCSPDGYIEYMYKNVFLAPPTFFLLAAAAFICTTALNHRPDGARVSLSGVGFRDSSIDWCD